MSTIFISESTNWIPQEKRNSEIEIDFSQLLAEKITNCNPLTILWFFEQKILSIFHLFSYLFIYENGRSWFSDQLCP
jgi:hypothetical protein